MRFLWYLLMFIGSIMFVVGFIYGAYLQISHWDLSEYGLWFRYPLENLTSTGLFLGGMVLFYAGAVKADKYGRRF